MNIGERARNKSKMPKPKNKKKWNVIRSMEKKKPFQGRQELFPQRKIIMCTTPQLYRTFSLWT